MCGVPDDLTASIQEILYGVFLMIIVSGLPMEELKKSIVRLEEVPYFQINNLNADEKCKEILKKVLLLIEYTFETYEKTHALLIEIEALPPRATNVSKNA